MYIKTKVLLVLILLFLGIIFIPSASLFGQTSSVTDIDGNTYKTNKIGEQWWMAENLRTTHFNNGDSIPFLFNSEDWAATNSPAFGYYNNNASNISKFGLLYNWFTVDDKREICPEGWHVPSDIEWIQLEKKLGMKAQETEKMTAWRGMTEGNKLKSKEFGGNNSVGFSALGTGYRHPSGIYKGIGTDNDYWTSTPYANNGTREGVLHGLLASKSTVVRNFHAPNYGFCVRCIQNKTTSASIKNKNNHSRIYPNPAEDILTIVNALGKELTIFNINGQIVSRLDISSSKFQTNVSMLNPGSYMVKITSDEKTIDTLLLKL